MPVALRAATPLSFSPTLNVDRWSTVTQHPAAPPLTHFGNFPDHFLLLPSPADATPTRAVPTNTAVSVPTVTALFNDMITELLAPPAVSDTTRRVVLNKDCFYVWPYREPSLFGKKPFAPFGFLMPRGTEALVRTRVIATATGFQRTIAIEVAAPGDQLGALGPINLQSDDPPLATTRIAKTVFVQELDAHGAVQSERIQLGLTFHDADTGARRAPTWIEEKALQPTAVPYRGGTLYQFDATDSFREVFAYATPQLKKAATLHQQETGQALAPGTTANIAAYLKYTWRHGISLAEGRFAERVQQIKDRLGYH
ncbi:MAG: hypothetical protein HY696_12485 [Deltaproteobacteria bacterium]|nr:hypothetical protein [Deltaproteobacteria bacterium]